MKDPLNSQKVVKFAGLPPALQAAQLLADLGAEVIIVDRALAPAQLWDVNRRAKRPVALNLKSEEGCAVALALIGTVDIPIEGVRPGAMERLGLGPEACPDQLIYGRMTGWGQAGPMAQIAGA